MNGRLRGVWAKFKYIDLFSRKVSLTHQGNPNFYTHSGAIVSVVFIMCMITTIAVEINKYMANSVLSVSSQPKYVDHGDNYSIRL